MTSSSAIRVAAVDCGTNSIRLLIADVDTASGTLTDVERRMTIVRLGQDVDRTGRLAPEALERTFAAARSYAEACAMQNVARIRFVATSATRDASNGQEFIDGIQQIMGVEPEIISGALEAELSFRGALTSLTPEHAAPYLVVDLGGGSTELALGTDAPEAVASMDIGCVRMAERHLHDDPPSPIEIHAAVADIDAALDAAEAAIPFGRVRTLVGLAGTVTTVTAHALELDRYDPDRIDGAELPIETVLASCGRLLHSTAAERSAMPFMHPGRVGIIGAGALVWSRIVARVAGDAQVAGHPLTHVVTSEHDILDGIALSLA